MEKQSTGYVWDRVKFFTVLVWDVFWICDQNSADNTLMFWQGLHIITAFSDSPCQSGAGGTQEGGKGRSQDN